MIFDHPVRTFRSNKLRGEGLGVVKSILIAIAMLSPNTSWATEYLGRWTLYYELGSGGRVPGVGITGLGMRVAFGPDAAFCCGFDLFEGSVFDQSDTGAIVVADLSTDGHFAPIAEQLTNRSGDDGVFLEYELVPFGDKGGAPWTEAFWSAMPGSTAPADFAGYALDRIDLVIDEVRWFTSGVAGIGDGVTTDYMINGSLHFYGTLLPEPTAIAIVTIGAFGFAAVYRRHPVR